jgi:hypothetical protein
MYSLKRNSNASIATWKLPLSLYKDGIADYSVMVWMSLNSLKSVSKE